MDRVVRIEFVCVVEDIIDCAVWQKQNRDPSDTTFVPLKNPRGKLTRDIGRPQHLLRICGVMPQKEKVAAGRAGAVKSTSRSVVLPDIDGIQDIFSSKYPDLLVDPFDPLVGAEYRCAMRRELDFGLNRSGEFQGFDLRKPLAARLLWPPRLR